MDFWRGAAAFFVAFCVFSGAMAQEPPGTGFAGVLLQSAEAAQRAAVKASSMRGGLLARDLVPGGAAERAGLRRGDLIISYEGAPIGGLHQLVAFMQESRPGQSVTFGTIRFGESATVSLMLDEWPGGWQPGPSVAVVPALGLTVEALTADVRAAEGVPWGTLGVRVREVQDGGAAAQGGIVTGDIIRAVGRTPIVDPAALEGMVQGAGEAWLMTVQRGTRLVMAGPGAPPVAPVAGRDVLAVALADGPYVMDNARHGPLISVGATLAQMPEPYADPVAAEVDVPLGGFALATVTAETRQTFRLSWRARGLVVTRVAPASRASRQGLAGGMVLREINQKPVTDPGATAAQLHAAISAPEPVLLLVEGSSGLSLIAFGGP